MFHLQSRVNSSHLNVFIYHFWLSYKSTTVTLNIHFSSHVSPVHHLGIHQEVMEFLLHPLLLEVSTQKDWSFQCFKYSGLLKLSRFFYFVASTLLCLLAFHHLWFKCLRFPKLARNFSKVILKYRRFRKYQLYYLIVFLIYKALLQLIHFIL